MTDPSPQQQPGYPTAEQQQAYAQQQHAAYAAQQPAQVQQGYQQPVPSQFTSNLPMSMMTLGLGGGGLAALLLAQIIAGADLVGNLLSLPTATILLTALCVTTGDKYRNFYRVATAGFTVVTAGSIIGSLIESSSVLEAKGLIGALLLLAGLGLLTAATLTMSDQSKAPAATAHTGVPTGVVQPQQATQQYPGQQPQQGGWQQ